MIEKDINNFIEPRQGQWQPNQKAELPLGDARNPRTEIALEGNNTITRLTGGPQTYTVYPGANMTITKPNKTTPNQTIAELQAFNAATSGDLTVSLKNAAGVVKTLTVVPGAVARVLYSRITDAYNLIFNAPQL